MELNGKIAIIGDGAWGTALALVLASAGRPSIIWGHDANYLREMRQSRENRQFLPGFAIPDAIDFEPDLQKAVSGSVLAVNAVPSKYLRSVFADPALRLDPETILVSLTKGIEPETFKRPSEILTENLHVKRIAALSGPSHAEEVARMQPASLVSASDELDTARRVQQTFSTPRFRVYASGDLVGVELAGAGKNVIALAAGIVLGMGLGDNALAALVTRGLAEMTRLGVALGGDAQTFAGLAGLGDLITTCVSPHGRNRAVGIKLAEGQTLDAILASIPGVPEGVTTTRSLLELARRADVDMPITEQVAAVLWEGKDPHSALNDLMTRTRKDEY